MLTTNLTLTSADTQYSHTISASTNRWTVQCRSAADVRMSEVAGVVATPSGAYSTIKSGGAFTDQRPPNASLVLYFASASAGVILEIVEFPV